MVSEETVKAKASPFWVSKIRDYVQLVKPNLSFMVVFSSVIGYLMAPGKSFNWPDVAMLFIGGSGITSSANIINQIWERHSDKLMKRTMGRPLPTNRISVAEALVLTILFAVVGFVILWIGFNLLSGLLGLISLLLYGFAYTPMKKVNPIATLIGAIPGALPPLIGWVAATNQLLDVNGWSLFLIQFFWQFPHFWAIAWVGYEDYLRAGIRMLPSREGKTRYTGMQCIIYSLTIIPVSMLPYHLKMTGLPGTAVAVICGFLYFLASWHFYRKNDYKSAKLVMYTSFVYLPTTLLAIVLNKL